MVHEGLARPRQRNAPRVSLQQADLQFVFKLLDLIS
jgi:hypothetical protein